MGTGQPGRVGQVGRVGRAPSTLSTFSTRLNMIGSLAAKVGGRAREALVGASAQPFAARRSFSPPPKKKSNFFRLFPRTGDIQIEEIMLYYCHKVWLYEDGEDANEQDRATWRRF